MGCHGSIGVRVFGALLAFCCSARSQTQLFAWHGDFSADTFGSAVASAGDVDGDGTVDVLVGAPKDGAAGPATGSVRVFSGATGTILFHLVGDHPQAWLGSAVSGLGDVNSDGHDDFLVASPGGSFYGTGIGVVRVHSGLDGSTLHLVHGAAGDGFGAAIAGLGDWNGDHLPDFAVLIAGAGLVRVYSGQDGSLLVTLQLASDGSSYGIVIAALGDLDGDAHREIAVGGSSKVDVYSSRDGAVLYHFAAAYYEYLGSAIADPGDIDGDGTSDIAIGAVQGHYLDYGGGPGFLSMYSGADGSLLYTAYGAYPYGHFGASIATIGDFDDDGVGELVVGAPEAIAPNYSGQVQILSGRTGKPLQAFGDDVNSAHQGASIAGVGDLNRDGKPEFVVGSPGGWPNPTASGRVKLLTSAALPLRASVHELEARVGGSQRFSLDAGVGFANRAYLLLGSLSGIVPGTGFGTLHVPLNPDAYFQTTLTHPNVPPLYLSSGVLDAQGRASAALVLPGNAAGFGAGTVFHHAFLAYAADGLTPEFASNAVSLAVILDPCALVGLRPPDCNANGRLDLCDIAEGTSADCNGNGRPDDCDLAEGVSQDCNADGVPDECDNDCNHNGLLDPCDIAAGRSADCDGNGVPDECLAREPDCNHNLVPDACDIASGTSVDCNLNGIPDECILLEIDLNHDGIPDECQPAQTFHVDDDAPSDPSPGDSTVSDPLADGSREHPFDAIQKAINASYSGCEIVIEDGHYFGAGNVGLNTAVGFLGRDIVLRSRNGPQNCVLDGKNSYGPALTMFSFERGRSRVTGLTFIDCNNVYGGYDSGGAILIAGSGHIRIDHCVFRGNRAHDDGGAVAVISGSQPGSVVIENCLFRGNSAQQVGGAILVQGDTNPNNLGKCTIRNCVFLSNGAGGEAGAIYIRQFCSVRVASCTFVGNRAPYWGGAIVANGSFGTSSLELVNTILWGNSSHGGVIRMWHSPVSISHCDLEGGAGAIYVQQPHYLLWGEGNIDCDPTFAPDTNGYHLQVGSCCLDAGDPDFNPLPGETDIDGDPRVLHGRVDIGADELRFQ